MPSIIDHGTGRNLVNDVVNGVLSPSPTERRFVTFLNEVGGVHTLIVDVEHAAKDAESLVKWFETARGLIATSPSNESAPNHLAPADVAAKADASIGAAPATEPAPTPEQPATSTGGGF